MDSGGDTKPRSGYGKPPWIFKGSALYQLHLVKSKTARACIPKDFKLVEAFGYTLGGFFLANYDQSPAGVFDELVVMAGLVWNPPTSCAWATKVLVNSEEACKHGQKEVGLPSQFARFSKRITAIPRQQHSKSIGFLNMIGLSESRDRTDVKVTEQGPRSCSFNITTLVPSMKMDKWMGPAINMSLPSFSGRTEHSPDLLKYSCKIQCRVQAVQPAEVSRSPNEVNSSSNNNKEKSSQLDEFNANNSNLSEAVMLSKPIFALKFSCMTMQVEAPVVIPNSSTTSLSTC